MNGINSVFILWVYLSIVKSNPQNPEINDQFLKTTTTDDKNKTTIKPFAIREAEQQLKDAPETENWKKDLGLENTENKTYLRFEEIKFKKQNPLYNIYKLLSIPVHDIVEIPKIKEVLHNIGTCIVNGVMDIITYYLPSPFIPLIASTASMMIPFEPIITLRRRMPVTSYRRAFKKAINGFLNTFERFKIDNYDEDPYMTRRFNRRFLNEDSKEKNKD